MGAIEVWFRSLFVKLRPEGLGLERRLIGFRRRPFHPRDEIAGFDVSQGMQIGSKIDTDLKMELRSGKTVGCGPRIPSREEALVIKAAMAQVLELD